jgi:hypothetical protein
MTLDPNVTLVAHHALLLAIPAFVPAFIVAGVIGYIAIKDRRSRDGAHSEDQASTDQDGSP